MEKPTRHNLTPYHAETPYAESKKLAEVITSWTPTPVRKFVTIRRGVSFSRMRDFARQIARQKVLVFLFGGFLQLATRTVLHGFKNLGF